MLEEHESLFALPVLTYSIGPKMNNFSPLRAQHLPRVTKQKWQIQLSA